MAIFEFKCKDCGHLAEIQMSIKQLKVFQSKKQNCPKCKKGKLKKLIPSKIQTSGFKRTHMKGLADNIRPPRPDDKGLI